MFESGSFLHRQEDDQCRFSASHRLLRKPAHKQGDADSIAETSGKSNSSPLFWGRVLRIVRNGNYPKIRPLRVWGIMIKPGVRSLQNLTVHNGEAVEEIGQPEVATQKVIIISQELARLQAQIDEFKKK